MNDRQKKGRWGEDQAVFFLEEHGIEIMERNWRHRHAELDIIGRKEGMLVFIEVKMRSGVYFGRPEDSITRKQRNALFDAASAYMRSLDFEGEIRFDILAITGNPGQKPRIEHFPDAFYPGSD